MKLTVEDRLNKIETTPALNLLSGADRNSYARWYMIHCDSLHKMGVKDLVKHAKSKLGKQKYCWTGSHKNWIWEFGQGSTLMRVFINNTQGICLEFDLNTKPSDVLSGLGFLFGQLIK